MSGVKFVNITKKYGEKVALNNVNLEIRDEEFMVILGPSGCGKTTLLRLIAGLANPTWGQVYIQDRNMEGISPKVRDVTLVFQNYALYPHMSVYDNLAFGLKMRGFSAKAIQVRVRKVAERLRISELLNRKPGTLSGGEKQRVALGRAIVRDPVLYLFDEPLSNLDAALRQTLRTEIKSLHKEIHKTMVYVTHDQIEALTLADRITILQDGAILQVGEPLDIYDNPVNAFVAGFVGSPPINFFEVEITGQGNSNISYNGQFSVGMLKGYEKNLEKGKKYLFGIRPEDITVSISLTNKSKQDIVGKIDHIEPLGSESIVFVSIGTNSFVVKDPSRALKPGDTVGINLSFEKLKVFDRVTGVRIVA